MGIVHIHYIMNTDPKAEVILDGIYGDKKGRLFQLAGHYDLLRDGIWVKLVNIKTNESQQILQRDMETYLRGGALKYEGFCATCSDWENEIRSKYDDRTTSKSDSGT